MRKVNVRLNLEDLNLELHQQIMILGHESEAEIIRITKRDFCRWARQRDAEWQRVALDIPDAAVLDIEIQAVA